MQHSTTDDIVFSKPMYLLKQRRKVYRIKGDGNCLYVCWAISYSMTNDQENYPSLKQLLERFENLNQGLFSGLLTQCQQQTIMETLELPNTWTTHVELIATATCFTMLCLHVYTFIADDQRWNFTSH